MESCKLTTSSLDQGENFVIEEEEESDENDC
jgi:hypothetical protein